MLQRLIPLSTKLTLKSWPAKCPPQVFKRFSSFEPLHPSLLSRAVGYSKELRALEAEMNVGQTQGFDVEKEKKYSHLSSIVGSLNRYISKLEQYVELKELISADPSLREEAQAEIEEVLPDLNKSKNTLFNKLLPPHMFADKPCLMEIRPGVGGTEAMIFAQDLLDMYINYCNHHRWPYRLLSTTENEEGNGIIEGILAIDEPYSYDKLKFESGVHRVQRIPATEAKGRIHTSTAAIVILPQLQDSNDQKSSDAYERSFPAKDIRIDVMRARGKGGQHVNTTDSAVRITHYPSGIVVNMQDERSQHKNKAKAFAILRSRLAEKERVEKEQSERKARTDQVSSTNRSDKIKTYNFPQNRVTDHRCNFSLLDMENVLNGTKLDKMLDEMATFDNSEKAKQLLAEIASENN
ncbi:Peptide chain release factor 1, mitochondrial [Hanseniaspora osmophila]|uniref:Peptide chain release factor 1, mitochondrial n=1 Tax=Hanseniaspora osmophila TaxID=56408 RepID=A0A1E5RNV6_9ASCO|nr:Peptide chain release factor 1, mitochondrial [Hanseniaspora osmophila]